MRFEGNLRNNLKRKRQRDFRRFDLGEKAVVITFSSAETMAGAVKSQPRHEHEIELFRRRQPVRIGPRLENAKSAGVQLGKSFDKILLQLIASFNFRRGDLFAGAQEPSNQLVRIDFMAKRNVSFNDLRALKNGQCFQARNNRGAGERAPR